MENEVKTFYQFKSFDEWRAALNKAPNDKWVKERGLSGSKKSKYIPLFIQQALADVFFREFDVIDEKYIVVANEIICTIKISFLADYPDSEHRFMTGVAAKPIQQDAGVSASGFPIGKKTNALEYNTPAARSASVSNALTNFGNVFGRNLNREVRNNYSIEGKKQKEDESNES